jgi:hypothetical protein
MIPKLYAKGVYSMFKYITNLPCLHENKLSIDYNSFKVKGIEKNKGALLVQERGARG